MKEKTKFNIFENMYDKTTIQAARLFEIIEMIKNGDDNSVLIQTARDKNDKSFTRKIEQLVKAIAWNCIYTGSKIKFSLKGMTGLVYFSKSNMSKKQVADFKELLKLFPFIVAAWQSVDGCGISCLVRCDDVIEDTFYDVWRDIDETIALEFDANVANINHLACLSFDADVYYNAAAITFPLKGTSGSESIAHSASVQPNLHYIEYDHIAPEDYDTSNSHFRYESEFKDHVFGDEEYMVFPNRIPFYKINTYYEARGDNRIQTMYYQAGVLALLNPESEDSELITRLHEINYYQCRPRMTYSEIRYIMSVQLLKLRANELVVKAGARKVVYKTNGKLTVLERRQLNAKIVNGVMRKRTSKIIEDTITVLKTSGEEILLKHIIAACSKSKRTIINYWNKYFKQGVEEYNRALITG